MSRRLPVLLGTVLLACPAPAQPPAEAPPVAEPAPREDLVSFDPREAQLDWNDRRWQVVADGHVLKDFGRRENEARQALRLIQDLGLTQRGTVGAPAPVMEYWLASGAGPTGLAAGLRQLPIDLPSLRVEQIQAQWCLRDNLRVLYNFGLRPEEARRALAIVRKYGFRHVVVVGQAAPSMTVLLCDPDDRLAGSPMSPSRIHPTSAHQNTTPKAPDTTFGSVVTAALPPVQEGGGLLHAHPPSFKGPDRPRTGASHSGTPNPGLPGWQEPGEWVPFDWRQVQLRQDEGGKWELASGTLVLARFGTDAQAGHLALDAVRHYRLTEQCRVGRPTPLFSYFLSQGQAPRGVMFGLSGLAFQPDKLSVQSLGQRWAVCEADKVLAILGDQSEAEQLLEAIQRNKFDRLVRLGTAEGEGMTLLLRVR
jgi:hypothetical protein